MISSGMWHVHFHQKKLHSLEINYGGGLFNFGSIELRKLALLHYLEELDITKESRKLSSLEVSQELALHESLREIRKQEEFYWKQHSRLQWLKQGDQNMNFFSCGAQWT